MLALPHRFPFLFAGFALLAGLACDDGTSPSPPTLDSLWPDEDGRTWSYRASLRDWEPDISDSVFVFATPDQVPDFPDWDTLIGYLRNLPTPPTSDTTAYSYGLRFEGPLTTSYGVTARNLVETVDGMDLEFCGIDTVAAPRLFLHALSRLDPRFRLAFARALGRSEILSAPNTLIHGGAFEKTSAWIGAYGCLDTLLAWKYLSDDLKPGATFTLQLIPSITDSVYLHARVYRQGTATTPAGRFINGLEVMYAVDFGIQSLTDVFNPDGFGYVRWILLGSVFYANGVGPVASYERMLIPVGTDRLGVGVGDVTLSLESYGVPSP